VRLGQRRACIVGGRLCIKDGTGGRHLFIGGRLRSARGRKRAGIIIDKARFRCVGGCRRSVGGRRACVVSADGRSGSDCR